MTTQVVRVAIEYVGHDLGIWCDDCMTSAGVRVWIATTIRAQTTLRSSTSCTNCRAE